MNWTVLLAQIVLVVLPAFFVYKIMYCLAFREAEQKAKMAIENGVKQAVRILRECEGQYYQCLESDYTSFVNYFYADICEYMPWRRFGFQHTKELRAWTTAPDWNPSPSISCGSGLHVVKWHPFFALQFVMRYEPIFFEVDTYPEPIPCADNRLKFRAQAVKKLRRVDENSPEFNRWLGVFFRLYVESNPHLFRNTRAPWVLTPKPLPLATTKNLIEHFDFTVCGGVFGSIAIGHPNPKIRLAVTERLHPKVHRHVLRRIARDNWSTGSWEDKKVALAALRVLDKLDEAASLHLSKLLEKSDTARKHRAFSFEILDHLLKLPRVQSLEKANMAHARDRRMIRYFATFGENPDVRTEALKKMQCK